jgi:ribosomal protein L37AE/L43A
MVKFSGDGAWVCKGCGEAFDSAAKRHKHEQAVTHLEFAGFVPITDEKMQRDRDGL